jgi:hypothetical protein
VFVIAGRLDISRGINVFSVLVFFFNFVGIVSVSDASESTQTSQYMSCVVCLVTRFVVQAQVPFRNSRRSVHKKFVDCAT